MENESYENHEVNHEHSIQNNSHSNVISSRSKIDNNPDAKNPWKIAVIVLGVVVVVLLFMMFKGGITGNVISEDAAGEKLTDYLNGMVPEGEVKYVSASKFGNDLYEIMVNYQEQDLPVYITKDGKYFVQGAVEIEPSSNTNTPSNTQTPQEVPKSDKPKVELFVWGYCPYGVQAQGPLTDVVSLLGNSADFEVVLYYDGHGDYETEQNKIQACIQDIAPDKYWAYSKGFVDEIYPKCSVERSVDCDKTESVKLMKSLGINDVSIMSCVDDRGEDLIAEYSARAQSSGVTGSPTLIINGVKVNTARNADAFKGAICQAFNNVPSECSEVLDSSAAAAAGNCL